MPRYKGFINEINPFKIGDDKEGDDSPVAIVCNVYDKTKPIDISMSQG